MCLKHLECLKRASLPMAQIDAFCRISVWVKRELIVSLRLSYGSWALMVVQVRVQSFT